MPTTNPSPIAVKYKVKETSITPTAKTGDVTPTLAQAHGAESGGGRDSNMSGYHAAAVEKLIKSIHDGPR